MILRLTAITVLVIGASFEVVSRMWPVSAIREIEMATFQVSNQTQLDSAISKVKGGDIVALSAGNYSSLSLVGKSFSAPVTFVSANAAAPAIIGFAKAINSTNIVFKNVQIGRALNPAVDREWTNMAQVEGSQNVSFDGVKFFSTGCDDKFMGRGLFVRGGANVTVKNSEFAHLAVGMATMSMANINILSNKFHDIRIDGAEFTAVAGGTVDGNDFRNFRSSPTAHPDAIQIWTAGTNKPTTDLMISNNIVMPGTGSGGQGIFIQDEVGGIPHERITIRNNLLLDAGNYYNGITVRGGRNITIEGNSSLSPTGDTKNFWIRLDNVQGAVVKGNLADQMLQANSSNIALSGNVFLNEQKSFASKISGLNLGTAATVSSLVVEGVGYQPVGGTQTSMGTTTTLTSTKLAETSTSIAPATTTTTTASSTSSTSTLTSFAAPTLGETLTPIATEPSDTTTLAAAVKVRPQAAAPLTLTIASPISPTTLLAATRGRKPSASSLL